MRNRDSFQLAEPTVGSQVDDGLPPPVVRRPLSRSIFQPFASSLLGVPKMDAGTTAAAAPAPAEADKAARGRGSPAPMLMKQDSIKWNTTRDGVPITAAEAPPPPAQPPHPQPLPDIITYPSLSDPSMEYDLYGRTSRPTSRPASSRIVPQSPPPSVLAFAAGGAGAGAGDINVTVIPPLSPGDGHGRVEHTLYAIPHASRDCCADDSCCHRPATTGGVARPRHPEIVHFNALMWVDGELLATTPEHKEPPHDRYEEDLLPMVRLKDGKPVRGALFWPHFHFVTKGQPVLLFLFV